MTIKKYPLSAIACSISLAILPTFTGSNAMAQQVASTVVTERTAEEESDDVEIIKVTGVGTNIAGVQAVGSKANVINRAEIIETGLGNIADVIRSMPQVQNLGEYREGGTQNTYNNTQGNAINLRGMGPSATLILVDGRRVAPTGTATTFTEANLVPMAALQMVEVISDGASAIYGSDAVAGVVNYVTRKDYDGAEASYRFADNGGYNEWNANLTLGKTWEALNGGNIIFSYEHSKRDALLKGDNLFLRSDRSRFGGLDGRLNGTSATPGIPGNIVVAIPPEFPWLPAPTNPIMPTAGSNTYYALPAGTNGLGLTAADLTANSVNLVDEADYSDYLGEMDRDQYVVFINQQLSESIEFYFQGLYTERDTYSRMFTSSASVGNFTLPASSPYYIEGIPDVAAGDALTVQYNFFKDFGHDNRSNEAKNYTLTAGLRFDLPGDWQGELYYTKGYDKACGVCTIGTNVNTTAFQAQINAGNINPLSSESLSAAQIATFTGDNIQISQNKMQDVVLKFNGTLTQLPAGNLKAAIGAEYVSLANELFNSANRGAANINQVDTVSGLEREINSAFAELYIPLVSDGMDVPLVKRLDISAAARYDSYSSVGSTTNPKIGITWELNDELALRGTWGTSFRAPGLSELNPYVYSVAVVFPWANNTGSPDIVDGAFPGYTNQLLLLGSSAELVPETATNWSLGTDYTPEWSKELKLGLTYYNISYEDRIVAPSWTDFYTSPESLALYQDYVIPIHNPSSCVEGDVSTYDPTLVSYVTLPNLFGGPMTNACGINAVTDARHTNLAATRQSGVDVEIKYNQDTALGFLMYNLNISKVLTNEEQVAKGLQWRERLDYYSSPLSLRVRGSVGWYLDNWSANLFVNHVGGYTNDQPITINGVLQDEHQVSSWTTADLGVAYSIDEFGNHGWLNGLRLSANISNVFDRDPPVVITSGAAFNIQNSNPFGRMMNIQITKAF